MLKKINADRDKYLFSWRAKAVNIVCDAFKLVKIGEISYFDKKLFFARKSGGLSPTVFNNDSNPSFNPEDITYNFEEPK